MKIICVDNYDREYISDALVASEVNEYYGKLLVSFLNKREGEHSQNLYKLVPNDYKLYKFEP